ncbi:cysteine-rich receptor-like protein kinase 6 [Lolium perenne]|uniref:cysteine-rich receptor-like protein kinase 6 n=1 Tax=Lolium perenne TaxID=4522 RepID=UPI003A992E8B
MARRLLLFVFVALLALPRGAVEAYPWPFCGAGGFLADSNYKASLSLLAAAMPKNASTSPGLFTTGQAGVAPEQVWALALCRGDASVSYCASCLDQAFQDLIASCDYKDATIYYDSCLLTYSNIHFRATDEIKYSPYYPIRNLVNATAEPAWFQRVVAALVNATASSAAFNSDTRLYASGQADFDKELPQVYSWAQCTPDFSPDRCWRCLVRIMRELPTFFTDAIGARVLGIRCSIRYETQPFFNGTVTVRLSATSASGPAPAVVPNVVTPVAAAGRGRKYIVPIMVPVILLPIVAIISLVTCLFLWRTQRPQNEEKQPHPSYSTEGEDIEGVDSMMIDISTLRAATGDFAESNKLGEGGFGAVYKGMLPDGEEIAVKRMSKSSTQGVEELKTELILVAKLSHKNLVRLIGVCLEQQERLLVSSVVPNQSLDLILFDATKREQLIDWGKRYNVIDGIARGLQYLHEDSQLKVVHRDLKASNILLDMNMRPKISDFGLAKIFLQDQTQGITNRVVGTYGYMAPEYMMRGNYSVKSDTFSFGVMVLEIVTGRKNNDDDDGSRQSDDLLTRVWERWMSGTVLEVVDPCMNGRFSEKEVLKCVHIGLLCVQGNPTDRPTMSVVVMMLGGETFTLHVPSNPSVGSKTNGASAD